MRRTSNCKFNRKIIKRSVRYRDFSGGIFQQQIMDRKTKNRIENPLDFIISAGVGLFLLVFGSSLLIGMLSEPEKSETFLIILGWGLLFAGLGCAIYCFYLLTYKVFKWMYYLAIGLSVIGYGLAIFGQAIYRTYWQ